MTASTSSGTVFITSAIWSDSLTGRYVGVVTIYQRFEGESEGGLKYKDTTKKDITIYVEKKANADPGKNC